MFVAGVDVCEEDDGVNPELRSSCLGSDGVALRKRAIFEDRGRRSRLHRAEVHGALYPPHISAREIDGIRFQTHTHSYSAVAESRPNMLLSGW